MVLFSFPLSITNVFISLFMAGLESAKSGNHEEAFLCFVTAAQQGYHKAHFNTAVCYEKGRGVRKDHENVRIQTAGRISFLALHHLENRTPTPSSEVGL